MSEIPFKAPSPEDLAKLLPQYEIERLIAQGGMGAVYAGRQSSLERDVAVKVLPRELGADPAFRESFATEAKAMARLNHPNLIGVFECGNVDGMPYIVMEYVSGGSLHESASNQAIEPSQAVAIVKGICDGLAHAHENNIVHRDIKPANILLTLKAEPKIGDFGLANATDADGPGLAMGTPGYTAPEVFQNPDVAGPLADIYSVGVILHQLLTGIDPAGSVGPPTHATGNIRLDAIWRRATHINPAQRYPSVAAMAADLDKWMASKPGTLVAAGGAAARVRRPVQMQPTDESGGLAIKFVLIAVLVAGVFFAYHLLQSKKQALEETTTETHGSSPVGDPLPVSLPDPEPKPEPPRIEPRPKPSPGQTAKDDEPGPPMVVEPEPDTQNLPPGDTDLLERAVGLINEARRKREAKYSENAKSLLFQLGSISRRATSSQKDQDMVRMIKILETDVVDNRIPIIDDVDGLPIDLIKIFKYHQDQEKLIETGYRSDLERLRNAYVTRLKASADENSDKAMKQRLLAQAARADDLDAWVGVLSPEPKIKPKRSAGSIGGFAGKWDVQAGELTQWVADPHGGIVINDGKWKGNTAKWKMTEDGTLKIIWKDKPKPYILTRKRDGWSGKTSFGQSVSITPGNW